MDSPNYYLESLLRGTMRGKDYTIEMCELDIKKHYTTTPKKKKININQTDYLFDLICSKLSIEVSLAKSKCRKRDCVTARQIFAKLAYTEYSLMTAKNIGLYLGGRDHSTILNTLSRFRDLYDTEDIVRAVYVEIKTEFDNYLKGND